MTSGAPAGSPGGAPRRFGYREWPAPSSSGGCSSPDSPGDSSIESTRVGGRPQSYEMSDRGASSRASTAPTANLTRPSSGSGSRPPSPASSSLGPWPPSPALHFRPLPRSSSSSSFFGFSDASTVPLLRPIHQSGPPAIPPRGDQFNYLPQRPTFFRYASHSAQTPASGFFNPRPIMFDQAAQTSPIRRNPDRQGPRYTGPLVDHQQPSGAVQSPLPGYSRSAMAAPSPFRPVVRGRSSSTPSSRPVRPPGMSPSDSSSPPAVWTVSPSPSRPRSPPPPFEASRPRSQSWFGSAAAATSTSTPSSSAAELGAWRSRSPLWPQIPPLTNAPTSGASSASSSASARATSRATSPTYAAVVSGAESTSPGGAASGGLLTSVTSPPAATTTALSSSSPAVSQVRSQTMPFCTCFLSSTCVLCAPLFFTPLCFVNIFFYHE